MISSSFFSVLLYTSDREPLEIGVCDLCADGFTFRLTPSDSARLDQPQRAVFRHRGLKIMEELTVTDFSLSVEETSRYCILYRLVSDDPAVIPFMRSVMNDLSTYTELKNNSSDAALSAFCTDYPADRETDFPDSFSSWRSGILSAAIPDPAWEELVGRLPALHLAISFSDTRKRFLHDPFPTFLGELFSASGFSHHPLTRIRPVGVCIGNAGCHRLFPDRTELSAMIRRCIKQGLTFTVHFPPVPENRLDEFAGILQYLFSEDHPGLTGIIINDWGMARLAGSYRSGNIQLMAGPLLARTGKDPRQSFRSEDTQTVRLSSADSPAFRSLLDKLDMSGILRESDSFLSGSRPGDWLALPFYHLTAATRCTLRSACRFGSRGLQPEGDLCTHECEKACFGYGRPLRMIGRGNCLFSFDTRFLTDPAFAGDILSAAPGLMILDLLE